MNQLLDKKTAAIYLAMAISCLWLCWVIVDYLAHHPYFTKAIVEMPYFKVVVFFLAVGLGGSAFVRSQLKKQPKDGVTFHIRGISLFALVQFASIIILLAFASGGYMPRVSPGTRLGYFLFTSTAYLLGFLLIILTSFIAGNLLLRPLKSIYITTYYLIAIALGMSLLGTFLSILGLFALLKQPLLWAICLALIIWQYKSTRDFLLDVIWKKYEINIKKWWVPLLFVLLVAIVSINWIGAFKPFPIGYDGGSLYMNNAELIAQSGRLPAGGHAFAWSVIMSFGQILFDSRTMAILLSHLMCIFCLMTIYQIARFWLTPAYALIAMLIPLSSPYFAYHSIVDEKIDLGFTFIILSSFILLIKPLITGWYKKASEKKIGPISSLTYLFLLSGWLCGFAFSIKYTAVLYLIALFCFLFYLSGNRHAFAGVALIAVGMLFALKIHHYGYLKIDDFSAVLFGITLIAVGLISLFYQYRTNWSAIKTPILQCFYLTAFFLLPFLPWMIKHGSEHSTLRFSHLIEGKEESPEISIRSLRQEEIQQLKDTGYSPSSFFNKKRKHHPVLSSNAFAKMVNYQEDIDNTNTDGRNATEAAAEEEIKRYIGFEPTFWLYSSLAYDLTMNTNIPDLRYLDIGFLFLLLFPLLLFIDPKKARPVWLQLLLVLLMVIWVAGVYYSIFAPDGSYLSIEDALAAQKGQLVQHPGRDQSFFYLLYTSLLKILLSISQKISGFYQATMSIGVLATISLLLAFIGGAYYLLKNRLKTLPQEFKGFCGFLLVYLLLWWIMGNGIIWYALPMFCLLPIIFIYYLNEPEKWMGKSSQTFSTYFLGSSIGLALALNGLAYFTSCFPNDPDPQQLFRWPFVEQITNPRANPEQALKAFNAVLPEAMTYMNADESVNIYRVNTHYGFHITANDRRVFSDPILEKFDEINSKLFRNEDFFDVLKANGFKYIFLDLKTGQADQSPEKKLRDKFIRLAELLHSSNKIRLLCTDNYVADPSANLIQLPNGKQVNARHGLYGQTVALGNVALFEIL